MDKLPNYTTIEIVEFPLTPRYSGDPFSEENEYYAAVSKRNKDILLYRDEKIGKKYKPLDYPQRTNIPRENSDGGMGERIFFHVSQRYYSLDNTKRILISGDDESDVITVIFQTAIKPICEQKTIE